MAWIVDSTISTAFALPGLAVLLFGPTETRQCGDIKGGDPYPCVRLLRVAFGVGWGLLLLGFVAYLVVYFRMLGRGATWGRKAAGYRVVDARSLQPIGAGRAVVRYVATVVAAMPCLLGVLWPLWDAERRALHDILMHTRAIQG